MMNVEAEDVLTLSVDSKGRVTIPSEIRKELGIDKDTDVEIAVLGTSDVESEKEAFAKEIYQMLSPLGNEIFQESDIDDFDEKFEEFKRVEKRIRAGFN